MEEEIKASEQLLQHNLLLHDHVEVGEEWIQSNSSILEYHLFQWRGYAQLTFEITALCLNCFQGCLQILQQLWNIVRWKNGTGQYYATYFYMVILFKCQAM